MTTRILRAAAAALLLLTLGATAVVACGYLFSQNWLQTVLLNDYVGWTYVPWLACAVAALADVVWNRARVCTMLVNGAANVLGAAACAVPC